jgi:hypothetical protein
MPLVFSSRQTGHRSGRPYLPAREDPGEAL